MKIKYVHAADPLLNGTETHLPQHIASVLVATGAAVEIKLPRRSEPGWAEARVAQSLELNHGPSAGDTVVEFFKEPHYSIGTASNGVPCIVKKSGTETSRIFGVDLAKSLDVPKLYVEQLRVALTVSEKQAEANAAERARADAAQQSEYAVRNNW